MEGDAIVGTTVARSPNTFLCKGPFGDFVLEFDVLCDTPLNSGVQIRSHTYEKDTPLESKKGKVRPAGDVYGYQCEITKAEEGVAGRGLLAPDDHALGGRKLDEGFGFVGKEFGKGGFYAREDNINAYNKWHESWIHPSIEKALTGLHTDVANAFYRCNFPDGSL